MNPRDMARALGRRGGRIRAQRLAAADRTRIASLGGSARARSLQTARRIEENFRYDAAVRSLHGAAPTVTRLERFDGRLPGIYAPEE